MNNDPALTFDDVLIEPAFNAVRSRKDVDISVKFGEWINLRVPVISSNMDTITGIEMACRIKELGGMGILHRFDSIVDNVKDFYAIKQLTGSNLNIGCSLGVNEGLERLHALHKVGCRIFCVDVAHGHSQYVGDFVKEIKNTYKEITVIAGNIATQRGASYLKDCGADIIKVGIGPGSACSTRTKTGCGVPQITAIVNCYLYDTIADGGIRSPGDVCKAIAAGSSFVMLGGMLAGTLETPGPTITDPYGAVYKEFRGNASREINQEKLGGMPEWKTAEGISTKVLSKGSISDIIADIEGGLRSALTYTGSRNIEEFQRNAKFIKVTNAGYVEGTPHILGN